MRQFAFFDADETLIPFKTMFEFKRYLTWQLAGQDSQKAAVEDSRFRQLINQMAATRPREEINRLYYAGFNGLDADYLMSMGRLWYRQLKQAKIDLFIQPVLQMMMNWRARGMEPVLVSGSAPFILQPFCQEIGITHLLCCKLLQDGGVLNGKMAGQPVIGQGKAVALHEFASRNEVDLSRCHAVGDHVSDFPMLEAVGHAFVVSNGNQGLAQMAAGKGWEVIHTPTLQHQPIQFI